MNVRPIWVLSAVSAVVLAAFPHAPVVTIDYKAHESFWRAQRNIVAAWEQIETAAGTEDARSHARKAQQFLIDADRELRLAAGPPSRK